MNIVIDKLEKSSSKGDIYKIHNRDKRNPMRYFISKGTSHVKRDQNFNYLSVLPGAGKTKWSIDRIISNALEQKAITIYMAPTLVLLEQVHLRLDKAGIKSLKYSSKDGSSSVKVSSVFYSDLMNAELGDVFLITHQLYFSLDREIPKQLKKKLYLLVDEASELTIEKTDITLDYDTALFFKKYAKAELFLLDKEKDFQVGDEFTESDFHRYKRFHMRRSNVKKYRRKSNGEGYNKKLFKLFSKMSDPRFSVYAVERERKFSFFNYYSPEYAFDGMATVYFISAFFELSEVYHILKRNYLLVDRSAEIINLNSKRIERIKENFKRVTLYPIVEDQSLMASSRLKGQLVLWRRKRIKTKTLDKLEDKLNQTANVYANIIGTEDKRKILNHIVRDFSKGEMYPEEIAELKKGLEKIGKTSWDQVCNTLINKLFMEAIEVIQKVSGSKCLYTVNKFSEDSVERYLSDNKIEGYQKLAVKSHGLNSYTHYNNLIFLVAMNPDMNLRMFFKEFMPDFDSRKQWVAANILQSLARLEVRNDVVSNPCNVVLYSTGTVDLVNETAKRFLGFSLPVNTDYLCKDHIERTVIRKGRIYITGSTKYKEVGNVKVKRYLDDGNKGRKTTEALFRTFKEYEHIFLKWRKVYDREMYLLRKLKTSALTEEEKKRLTSLSRKQQKYSKMRQEVKIKIAEENNFDYKPRAK